jgi:ERCC4-type nuclease
MIRVDSRIGSGELDYHFKPFGITLEKTKLEFGDFDFEGKGPKGGCGVVFERKRIEDLVDSMQSGRLSGHQLPGMSNQYDYGYLIIEGIWRAAPDGRLEVGNHGWKHYGIHVRAITNYVMGLALRAGLIPWRTATPRETVEFIVDQYRMWTEKEWHEHKSHDQVYAPAQQTGSFGLSLISREVGTAEKLAMQLPGLDAKARFAARHFKTGRAMANAAVEDWERMSWKTKGGKARLLGKEAAKKIVAAWNQVTP